MAGGSLLALIDDIAAILDDVAVLTKVAIKKTAGVLGDDLALNAEQVAGLRAERELPVVFAVAKGSLLNKAILVPAALLVSAVAPWAILPLLMVGGSFLCFEGFEKVVHRLRRPKEEDRAHRSQAVRALADPAVDVVAAEKEKVRGAIRTDFVLSAEIIVIALGTVAASSFFRQVVALVAISILMTVGVYGLVAAIVKLDDAGLALHRRGGGAASVGKCILRGAPLFMKGLTVVGTAAMFLVGGSILAHGVPPAHHVQGVIASSTSGVVAWVGGLAFEGAVGIAAGGLCVLGLALLRKVAPRKARKPAAG